MAGDERAVEETNPGRDSPGFLSTRLKIGSGFISLPKSRTPVRQHFPSAMALTELQEPLAYSGPVVVAALFHPPKFCLFIKGFLFFFLITQFSAPSVSCCDSTVHSLSIYLCYN